MSKKYITDIIKIDGQLLDGNGSAGTSGQILSSTGTATDWISLSEISGVDGTGTANYVAKWSDTDTITDSVIYDDGTNVGIGTSSPAQKLHVDGNIRVGDTNDVIYADKFFTVSNANLHIGANNGYDTVFFNGPADERMRITSSGNIGIGTTNPDYKLEVDGTLGVSRTDGIIFAGSTGTGTGSKIASNTSNDLIFSTALASVPYTTTERVRILNNGNVGIGTDSPNDLLEIKSTTIPGIRLNSTDTSFPTFGKIDAYNNTTYRGGITWAQNPVQDGARITYIGFPSGVQTTGTFEVGPNFVDTSINNGSMVTRLTTTGLGIGTTSPTATLQVDGSGLGAKIHSAQTTGLEVSGGGNSQDIARFQNVSGTTKVTIDTGGNVGIGTTSPSQKLQVNGIGEFAGALRITETSTSQNILIGNQDSSGTNTPAMINGVNGVLRFGKGNSWSGEGGTFTEAMRVNTSGNVGIGTTSPVGRLSIGSGLSTDNSTMFNVDGQYNDVGFNGGTSGLLSQGVWSFINSATWDQTRFYVQDQNNSDSRLTFDFKGNAGNTNILAGTSSGKVGIGTTSPGYKLDVNGSIRSGGNYLGSSSAYTYLSLANGNYHHKFYTRTNTAAASERFTIEGGATTTNAYFSNVNVGIGTTSPGAKLDIFNTGGSAGSLADCQTYSALTVKPYSSVDSKLTFSANGVSTQLIQATNNAGTTGRQISLQPFSGNVGIGVTLPSEKLDVNGSIKASASTDAYKGYIKSVITTGYSMKSASTAYQYIPYNSYTLTTLQAYYNRTVAAYNGRVKKIIVKRIDGASADATGMKFKKEINGTVIATEYTATVLSGSGNFQATYDFAQTDFTFSAGDSIGVLMQSSGGTGMIGAGAIQIVLEYNIT